MKISEKSKLTIKIVTYLLENGEANYSTLSEHLELSEVYITTFLHKLLQADIVERVKGNPKHIMVPKSVEEMSLWFIIEHFDKRTLIKDDSVIDILIDSVKETASKIKIKDLNNYQAFGGNN